jgi:WhiB family transcriptional regulator, redox-sensing transcriptional regulator
MTHLVANPVEMDSNGLCSYSDPENWFDYRKANEAKRICGNCPIRKACARAALDLEVIDGVWGGVNLPGEHATIEEHAVARRQLAFIVAAMDRQPESHRQRSLAIRAAMHYAAFPGQRALVAESASA